MKYLLSFFLLIITAPSFATIYMQRDANGNIIYSDTPSNNAQPVSLSPGNSVPSTTTPQKDGGTTNMTGGQLSSANDEQLDDGFYNLFTLVSPTNNETFQNQPIITVKVAIDPELRSGDTVQVYVDGKAWGSPIPSTTIAMNQIERGEHTLYAKLLDKDKKTLKQTDSIKIFVHRASANFNTAFNSGTVNLAALILH